MADGMLGEIIPGSFPGGDGRQQTVSEAGHRLDPELTPLPGQEAHQVPGYE